MCIGKLNWIYLSAANSLLRVQFYKSYIKAEFITMRITIWSSRATCHPVYHFVYCHYDVDWILLSLVMWSDRCTWLASCYVTHIRFHWQKIHVHGEIFRYCIIYSCVTKEEFYSFNSFAYSTAENGYVWNLSVFTCSIL